MRLKFTILALMMAYFCRDGARGQTITVTACSKTQPTSCGTAQVTVMPPIVETVAPATAAVPAGSAFQFSCSGDPAGCNWTVACAPGSSCVTPGTIDATGKFTAPPLQPAVTITPTTASFHGGDPGLTFSLQPTTAAYNFSISPQVGTLDRTTGFVVTYTPPASITAQQTVTLAATSSTGTATATITLKPPGVAVIEPTLFCAPPLNPRSCEPWDSHGWRHEGVAPKCAANPPSSDMRPCWN